MDEQDELSVLGREQQPLPAPLAPLPAAVPRARASGGSNVFSVAMCAGPARSTGNARTGSSRARRSASTSGSSGTYAPAHGPDQGNGEPRAGDRGRPPRPRCRRPGRAHRRQRRRPGARHLLPLFRRSRSRRCRSRASATTSTESSSRSRARRTAQCPSRSPPCEPPREGPCDRGRPRVRPAGRPGAEAARATTAPASMPGFLAVCRARGWPTEGYRFADHPMQQLLLGRSRAAEVPSPTTSRQRSTAAASSPSRSRSSGWRYSFSRLAHAPRRRASARRDGRAPRAVGYEQGAIDTDLMRARPGWIAKGGAEGLFCAASPDGLGVALKVEDGAMRALRPALAPLPRARRRVGAAAGQEQSR